MCDVVSEACIRERFKLESAKLHASLTVPQIFMCLHCEVRSAFEGERKYCFKAFIVSFYLPTSMHERTCMLRSSHFAVPVLFAK